MHLHPSQLRNAATVSQHMPSYIRVSGYTVHRGDAVVCPNPEFAHWQLCKCSTWEGHSCAWISDPRGLATIPQRKPSRTQEGLLYIQNVLC